MADRYLLPRTSGFPRTASFPRTAAAAAVLFLTAALAACGTPGEIGPTSAASASPGAETTLQEPALAVGDCIEDSSVAAPAELETVPCEQSHGEEVFHVAVLPGEEYDAQAVDEKTATECTGDLFTQYVGIARAESVLDVLPLYPTAERWADGDHTVYCILADPAGPVTGSLRGAAR